MADESSSKKTSAGAMTREEIVQTLRKIREAAIRNDQPTISILIDKLAPYGEVRIMPFGVQLWEPDSLHPAECADSFYRLC